MWGLVAGLYRFEKPVPAVAEGDKTDDDEETDECRLELTAALLRAGVGLDGFAW